MLAQNETFTKNYGLSKGLGGALHIKGSKTLGPVDQSGEEASDFESLTLTYNNESEPTSIEMNQS